MTPEEHASIERYLDNNYIRDLLDNEDMLPHQKMFGRKLKGTLDEEKVMYNFEKLNKMPLNRQLVFTTSIWWNNNEVPKGKI